MSPKLLFACLTLVSAVLPAFAFHPGRTDTAGYPIVVPSVKSLKPASGTFVLPLELTVSQEVAFDLSPLEKTYATEVASGSVRKVSDEALCRFALAEKGVPESKEGYRLVIAPDGICITARTTDGLYYGMQTLCWMLRNREGDALKACTVVDEPTLPLRGAFLEMNNLRPDQMARQCEALEGLAALKYNVVLCDFADNLPLSVSGEFNRKTTLTRENAAAFIETAKRCRIQIIPYLQVLSHALWMTRHKDWNSLKEADSKGSLWDSGYCPQNSEANRIVRTVVRETCDLFNPKLFHMSLDEQKGCPHGVCPKCQGKKWADLVVDHAKPIADELLSRGIRPIVYQDEFTRKSMTRSYSDLVEVPERLGKKTLICLWQYEDNPTPEQWEDFKERGFKGFYMSYSSPYNVMNLPKLAHRLGAPGVVLAWWLKIPSTLDRVNLVYSPRHCANTIYQAVYSWNSETVEFSRLPFDPLVTFRQAFGPTPPVKLAGESSSVLLGGAATALVGGGDARFPTLDASTVGRIVHDAAKDGFRLETDKGGRRLRAAVLASAPDEVQLPKRIDLAFAGTANGFSFLMAAAPFSTFDLGSSQPLVAKIRVRYVDGKEEVMPIFLYGDIAPWNDLFGGIRTRLVSRFNDTKGLTANLCAADWKNPRPEVEIAGIEFESMCEKGVHPALFGVAARGAERKASTSVANVARPVDLAQNGATSFERICRLEKEADIKGMRSISCKANGVSLPIRKTLVDDPVHGKVLEVFVPRGDPPVNTRLYLEFPTSSTQEFATVRTSIFCDHPEVITRSDMYVSGWADGRFRGDAAIAVTQALTPGWTTLIIPRTRFRNKEGGGVRPDSHTGIVIAFFLTPGVDTVFRFASPELTMKHEPCRIDVRAKVE